MQECEHLSKFWSLKEPIWDISNSMSESGLRKRNDQGIKFALCLGSLVVEVFQNFEFE